MQSIAARRSFAARAESLARVLVQGSVAVAVLVGCLIADPLVGGIAGLTFVVVAVMARLRFESTTAVLLFLAYINGGVMFAVPPPLTGAPLWVVAISGLVAGGTSWTRWSSPLAWRWPLILWLLGIALSWPIVAARETDFSLLTERGGVAAVVVGALVYLSAALWLDATLSWDAETIERRVARPLLASAIVSACAVFYQGFVDFAWLSAPPWIELRRAPGLMGDANPMAVALGIWAPLAIVMWRTRHGVPVGGMLTIALWCAAWLTGARTVLLQLCTGIVGVARGALSGIAWTRVAILLLGSTILVVTVVALMPFEFVVKGPIARLITNFPARQPSAIVYEAFWSRDGYGLAAAKTIREFPWSGVGVGTYNYILTDYYIGKGIHHIVPDNAQNFWRHALGERGIFAFVAVVALTFCTGRLLIRRVQGPPLLASTLKATIIGLGLALLFGVPTQNAAIAVTATAIISWLHALARQPETFSVRRYTAALVIAWVAVAVAGVVVDGWKAVTDLRPAVRAARVGDVYAYGLGDVQFAPDGSRGRPILGRAVAAVKVASGEYEVRYWTQGSATRLRVWQDGTLVMDERVRWW